MLSFYLILPIFLYCKMTSAFYVCCIDSSALQARIFMELNNKSPDETPDL